MRTAPATPGHRYYLALVAGYLLFIGFASFYLTDFITPQRAARAGIDELFFLSGEFRLRWWNLRDISTNILLYMPLGFLVAMTLAATGRHTRAGLHWWWGLLVSVGVEVVQAFIGRFSDATDVLSNSGGYVLGFAIARVGVQRYGINPASLLGLTVDDRTGQLNTLAGLRFVYLAVVLVTALLPLDISVSLSQVYAKLQAGDDTMPRLILDPFYQFRHGPDFQYLTLKLLVFLPLAFLSAFIALRRGQFSLLMPAWHCLLLALIMEGTRLFIRSGRSDILVPLLGFGAGLAVAGLVAAIAVSGRRTWRPDHENQYLLASAALLYGVLLLAISLSPYDFELSLRALRNKLFYDSNLVPFRLHFSARSINAAVDLVREAILYAPLGALLSLWLRRAPWRPSARLLGALAVLASLLVAAGIELLQVAVVRRYADLTDVLLAALGGLAGASLAPLFDSPSTETNSLANVKAVSKRGGPPG